ncbi:MAG: PKD domain-containing protein [Patescibacteria group bacterium]
MSLKKVVLTAFVALMVVVPAATHALTLDELQIQIRDLLAFVSRLQAQLDQLRGSTIAPPNPGGPPPSCRVWYDGCNTCTRGNPGGNMACTELICMQALDLAERRSYCREYFDGGVVMPPRPPICRRLLDAVGDLPAAEIQEFLRDEGIFNGEPTGFFGGVTQAALGQWQEVNGIVNQGQNGWGNYGPRTRDAIRRRCEGGGPNQGALRAKPMRGLAPLLVTFMPGVRVAGPTIADAPSYKINFGDGSPEQTLACPLSPPSDTSLRDGFCQPEVTHTYGTAGTYTASLVQFGGYTMGPPHTITKGQVTITVVGGPDICPAVEYQRPICRDGEIPTPGQHLSGQCPGPWICKPKEDSQCKMWGSGCSECTREYPGGPATCTPTDGCYSGYQCKKYFDGVNGNKPPTISSFSGPTTLQNGESGTWTINASDPENGTLSYDVKWGDEVWRNDVNTAVALAQPVFTQATTLSHAYSQPGTYTVSVIVRDIAGNVARASSTVQVRSGAISPACPGAVPSSYCSGSWEQVGLGVPEGIGVCTVGWMCRPTICTGEYAPACGRPDGCVNTCTGSGPCTNICQIPPPQTYANKCVLRSAQATFLHEGACRPDSGNWY